jgi:APA family basic amino acid/polyamine antiporter
MKDHELKRTVTTLPAILLVISAIIGSGVFKKIAPMSDSLQSPWLILICWGVAGLISLIGALCTAELASMMPGSGGEFVYFKSIYGRFFSFLYGWANLAVMKAATIAALAYIFSESFNVLFPLPEVHLLSIGSVNIKILGSLLIAGLTFVNIRGLVFGESISRVLIIGIIVIIIGFVIAGVYSGKGSMENFASEASMPEGWHLFAAFFAASLSAFWGYEGWNNIGYIGEEIKNPARNIPIALGVGTIVVIILYLLVNAAYLYVMPVGQLAQLYHQPNTIAAVEVARLISGNSGAVVLSTLILLTTFNCTNSTMLMAARIFFAMSRDKLFIQSAGKVHPKFKTPSGALLLQCIWAIVLLWSGNFDQLTDLLIFASFIFYGSTAVGVIVMRVKQPDANRPFKIKGYPLLPAFFALFCLTLVIVTIIQKPVQSGIGLLLISLGIPVYFYYLKKNQNGSSRV